MLTRNRIFVTAFEKPAEKGSAKVDGRTTQEVMDPKSNYKLLVICLDRQTGKLLWQREVPRAHEGRLQLVNGPASPSPVTDGSNVYVFFQEFGLVSYDVAGKERWRLPLGPFNMFYGFGASPILVDDKVILPVDQDSPSSYLIAVDKNSGRVRWKVERPVVISGYSTPISLSTEAGSEADRHSRIVSALGLLGCRWQESLVGAWACMRDEIDCQQRRRISVHQRLGLPAESTGPAGGNDSLGRSAAAIRQEQ